MVLHNVRLQILDRYAELQKAIKSGDNSSLSLAELGYGEKQISLDTLRESIEKNQVKLEETVRHIHQLLEERMIRRQKIQQAQTKVISSITIFKLFGK